jgi:hypothetical protein
LIYPRKNSLFWAFSRPSISWASSYRLVRRLPDGPVTGADCPESQQKFDSPQEESFFIFQHFFPTQYTSRKALSTPLMPDNGASGLEVQQKIVI